MREVPKPLPGPGELLIRITRVGVCGSDIHLFRDGRIGDIRLTEPLVIGHECVGVVEAAGPGADAAWVGRRVAVEPARACGECRWCAGGLENMCPHCRFLGLPPIPGAMQDYIVHPQHLVEPLPASVGDDAGVVLEPMAVAAHAIRLAKPKDGRTVVILGTGVLGSCVLMLLAARHRTRVVCADIAPDRLERARRLGAEETVLVRDATRADAAALVRKAVGGDGADTVFECAGASDTLRNMCEVAAPGAHVAVIGTSADDRVEFSSGAARRKGLTIRFVRRSLHTLGECVSLAEAGTVHPGELVTHTFAPDATAEAFCMVERRAEGVLKAVIDMTR